MAWIKQIRNLVPVVRFPLAVIMREHCRVEQRGPVQFEQRPERFDGQVDEGR